MLKVCLTVTHSVLYIKVIQKDVQNLLNNCVFTYIVYLPTYQSTSYMFKCTEPYTSSVCDIEGLSFTSYKVNYVVTNQLRGIIFYKMEQSALVSLLCIEGVGTSGVFKTNWIGFVKGFR